MSLPRAAVLRPVTTIASVLAIVLLGSVSLGRTPVSLLPDVQLPVLTIRTLYTGAAAEEVSRFVAEPVQSLPQYGTGNGVVFDRNDFQKGALSRVKIAAGCPS